MQRQHILVGDALLEFNGQALDGPQQSGTPVHDTPSGSRAKHPPSGEVVKLEALFCSRRDPKTQAFRDHWHVGVVGAMTADMPGWHYSWQSRMLGVECKPTEISPPHYFVAVKQGVLIVCHSGISAEKAGLKAGDVVYQGRRSCGRGATEIR